MAIVEDLERARAAYESGEWLATFDALAALDQSDLAPADLERLGTAAYLVGRMDTCVHALQRAYQVQLAGGETMGAVRSALSLGMALNTTGQNAMGAGWVARAERMLDDLGDDTPERGWVFLHLMFGHLARGEFEQAHERAVELTAIGQRFRDPDLTALGLMSMGRLLMHSGEVARGLHLLDEAMVSVAAGEVSAITAGSIYCSMIEACQEVSDLTRAAEWTAALTRWCDEQPGLVPFMGQSAVHRGQMMRAHGAFAEALDEYAEAARRYRVAGSTDPIGLTMRERGDVLRLTGAAAEAEEAYAQATANGCDAHPGLALLWLAQGRRDAAAAAVRRMLGGSPDPVARSGFLMPAFEVLLACGQRDEAAAVVAEFSTMAESFGCLALQARAAHCRAALALNDAETEAPSATIRAPGDSLAATALAEARAAQRLWLSVDAVYDAARARVLVGRALRVLGDEDSGVAELTEARRTLVGLGAGPAAAEVDLLLIPALPRGLTAREVEVLRLVASGHSNSQIADALVLSEKTVARHLSNIFTKLDVSSRTSAAAFAIQHHLA